MFCIIGCGGCEEDKPLQKVEIKPEAQQLNVVFERFDNDLFGTDLSQPDSATQFLYHKYGSFYCDFIEADLRLAPCQSPKVGKLLVPFVQNKEILETRTEVQKIFDDKKIESITSEMTDAMRKWHHYFPDSLVPKIIYYQSAWNSNIAATDSVIGISLDSYLGKKHKITQQLSPEIFPAYKKSNMDERFITADAVKGWIAFKSRHYYKTKDLLSELIFYGKLMYISEALAPNIADSTMMSWSARQMKWAEENEWNVWKTLANEKVMFQNKSVEINKWFNDGPFTGANGVPQDSPPQLGVWFGWKIVRQYMQANPTITPQQLLLETDSQKILSAYKPKR